MSMKGKNVKDRTGLGRMDAERIRGIMGEAPARSRGNGSVQPSFYGDEYLRGIPSVQRRSLHIPAVLHRKLSILAGASENGKVTLEGFINHLVSRHLEEYKEIAKIILNESLPGQI
jgi:hypothetical protein